MQDDAGDYALLFAAFHGHNEIINRLCKAGAEADLQNASGHTAMMIAVVRKPRENLPESHPPPACCRLTSYCFMCVSVRVCPCTWCTLRLDRRESDVPAARLFV
eukprot:1068063-Prymnesium_polylepis.1